MPDNGTLKKTLSYLLFGVLAVWAGLVMYRFYREHPLGLTQFYRLMLRVKPLPLPAGFQKIAIAAKYLALACLLAATGVLAGRQLLKLAGVATQPESSSDSKRRFTQELILALGLGWGFLMYFTFLLGVLGGLYSAAIWMLIVLLLCVCLRDIPALVRELRLLLKADEAQALDPLQTIGIVSVAVMLLFIIIMALAPSITHDAMVYHLDVPKIYTQAHRIAAVPYNLFSNTFLNMEMLYAVALLVDDFILANLIHYIFGVATVVFLYYVVQGAFGCATAILTVLIFFFNPSFLNQMPLAYGDIGMTFYFSLALYCLWKWRTEGSKRWFVLLCVFAGIFAGMKYTAIYGLFTLCVMIAAVELSSGKRRIIKTIRRLALFGLAVTVFVAPYLIKNYLITGNPVYPVMYNVFDGRWLCQGQVSRMLEYVASHGMGHDWRHMVALPWNITIFGNTGFANFDTVITPLWLIFLPAFIFIRPKPSFVKWAALACTLYFLSWAASTHITRYMMPIFPLLSFLCAFTIIDLARKAASLSDAFSKGFKVVAVLICGLVWFSFSYFYPPKVPAEFGPVVWGSQTRDEFLAIKVPNYRVFKYISEELPPDARLMFFWDNRGFFCNKSKVGDSVIEAPMMIELAHKAGSADAFHSLLKEMGVTHVLFNFFFFEKFPTHKISKEDDLRFANDLLIFHSFLTKHCVTLFSSMDATLYEVRY